jgi:hypothetical protein
MTRPTDYYTAMRLFYGHRGCIGWGNITDGPGDLDEILADLITLATVSPIITNEQPSLQTLIVWRFQADTPPRDVTEDVLNMLADRLAQMEDEAYA